MTLAGGATSPLTGGLPATATEDVKNVQVANADLTEAKAALTAAGVTGTASVVKMSYTDNNGKTIDGGLAVKVGDDYYSATQNKDGSISINTTKYTADDGTSKTALNKLGGADGKTEVVSIGGKTYAASKAEGHNFKAQPDLAEAAATTTENPLQKIDAALAQVDTLRSDPGAVQNRFNSAITNPGNTVNNLTSARSRIEDSDYATEVSNMSRAQILQQAGTSVLAQANQGSAKRPLFTALIRRLIHRHVVHNQGSESCLFNSGACVMKEITVTEPAFVTRFSCSGSACRDHCCKGWKITLDKTTVKNISPVKTRRFVPSRKTILSC